MQARQTFSINFYCRNAKTTKKGVAPIEMSILVNGERVFISLPRKMRPDDFIKDTSSRTNNETKRFISIFEGKANAAVTEIVTRNEIVTANRIKDYITGKVCHKMTLSKLISAHLALLNEKTKGEITLDCFRRYEITYDLFLSQIGDKPLSEITMGDIQLFRTRVMNTHNASTSYGYMARIKTLFKYAVDNKHMQTSPMAGMKLSKGQKQRQIPTMEEFKRIVKKRFDINRLEKVRQIFVLSASTGLSYSDLMALVPSDIKQEGNAHYIEKQRKKTGVTYTSVILPEGIDILKAYNNDISPLKMSGQKLNAYLKEIGDICKISTTLTMHIGRHIYCTRLIQAGISPAIVQRAMGHSKITTTQQFYTHLTTQSVINNIKGAI